MIVLFAFSESDLCNIDEKYIFAFARFDNSLNILSYLFISTVTESPSSLFFIHFMLLVPTCTIMFFAFIVDSASTACMFSMRLPLIVWMYVFGPIPLGKSPPSIESPITRVSVLGGSKIPLLLEGDDWASITLLSL